MMQISSDDYQQAQICSLAWTYADCVNIDVELHDSYVFAKEILVPCFRQLMTDEHKCRVPLHYKLGSCSLFGGSRRKQSDDVANTRKRSLMKPRFYAVCSDPRAEAAALTVETSDEDEIAPVRKRQRTVRFVDDSANASSATVVPTAATLFEEIDKQDSQRMKLNERRKVLNEVNKTACAVLIFSDSGKPARVFLMDVKFAFQLYSFAYKIAYRKNWPLPPQLEALVNSAWMVWRLPTRSVVQIAASYRTGFLLERVLNAGHLALLNKQLNAVVNRRTRSAGIELAGDRSDTSAVRAGYWSSVFGDSLVFEHDDTSSHAGDALSEFGADSLLASTSSATGNCDSQGRSEQDRVQYVMTEEALFESRRQLAAATRLNTRLTDDSYRSGLAHHEFYERLCGPVAARVLNERTGRLIAAANQLLSVISYNRFNLSFTQTDLFYMQQLMQHECDDTQRRTRTPRPDKIDALIGQLSPAAHKAVERIQELRYVFLVNMQRRYAYRERNAAMVAVALYYSNEVYVETTNLLDRVDFGTLLDMFQSTGTPRQRYTLACHTPAKLTDGAEGLLTFMKDNALVGDERRVAELLKLAPMSTLRVPLNDARLNKVDTPLEKLILRSSNGVGIPAVVRVTPMSVLGTLRNLFPEARDGIDFYVSYTPLSFAMSTDERYKRAYNATAINQPLYVGDDEEERQEEQKQKQREEAAGKADEDGGEWTIKHKSAAKKRRGRPSRNKRGRPLLTKPMAAERGVPLAETAIYVGMQTALAAELPRRSSCQLLHQRAQSHSAPHMAYRNASQPLAAPLVAQVLAESTNSITLCAALNALHALIGGSGVEWDYRRVDEKHVVRTARTIVALANQLTCDDCDTVAKLVYDTLLRQYEYEDSIKVDREARTSVLSNKLYDSIHPLLAPMHVLLTAKQGLPLLVHREVHDFLRVISAQHGSPVLRQAVARGEAGHRAFRKRYQQMPPWWPYDSGAMSDEALVAQCMKAGQLGWLDSEDSSGRDQDDEAELIKCTDLAKMFCEARQLGVGDTERSQRCRCGGANVEECSGLLRSEIRRRRTTPKTEALCCVCTLNTTDPPNNAHWKDAPSAGACEWCCARLLPRRLDYAERKRRHLPDYKKTEPVGDLYFELGTAPELACELVECVLSAIDEENSENCILLLASIRRRHRNWASRVPAPRTLPAWRASKASSLNATYASVAEQLAAEKNRWLAEPLAATYSLLAPSGVQNSEVSYGALGIFMTALEVQTLSHHAEFVSAYEARENTESLYNLLFPFRSTAALQRYCTEHSKAPLQLPVCPPVLAESTALGGTSVQSTASNFLLPVHQRLQALLYNSAVARPLAACLPLLQETLMMNVHWPSDDRRAAEPEPSMTDLCSSSSSSEQALKSRPGPFDDNGDDTSGEDDETALRSLRPQKHKGSSDSDSELARCEAQYEARMRARLAADDETELRSLRPQKHKELSDSISELDPHEAWLRERLAEAEKYFADGKHYDEDGNEVNSNGDYVCVERSEE